jgi:outer membrane protein OmpA-like peptidoglycan-associated protein
MQHKTLVASLIATVLLATAAAFAGDNKAEIKGMITTRNGDTMIVKSAESATTVVITDDTITNDNVGLFGLGRESVSQAALIPGLKVDVDGTPDDQGRIVAKTITVDGDDMETAEMVQAGLHPTAEQVAANIQAIRANRQGVAANKVELAGQKQSIETNQQNIAANKTQIDQNIKDIEEHTNRFNQLADYDVKGQAVVKFGVGSAVLDKKDKEDLKNVAQTATAMSGGYLVEVMGYADATGGAAMNTKLSERRAAAVINYLVQQCGVRPRFIVAPGAMGEYGPAAPNETKAGRAENRRVEIKVLVNKGIAGSNS